MSETSYMAEKILHKQLVAEKEISKLTEQLRNLDAANNRLLIENSELRDKVAEAVTLLDSAFNIIEIWKAQFINQKEWQRDWLQKAYEIIKQSQEPE